MEKNIADHKESLQTHYHTTSSKNERSMKMTKNKNLTTTHELRTLVKHLEEVVFVRNK